MNNTEQNTFAISEDLSKKIQDLKDVFEKTKGFETLTNWDGEPTTDARRLYLFAVTDSIVRAFQSELETFLGIQR